MAGSARTGRVQGWLRVVATWALLLVLALAPVTNSLTHGPAAHADRVATLAEATAHGHSHGHSHGAATPASHHDGTDHDHPTVALIPPQVAAALPRLPALPRPAPQLSDGRERGDLLRPPRGIA